MKTSLVVLAATFALLATSCGGDDAADDGVASLTAVDADVISLEAVPEVDREAALLEFAACIRDEGVDINDPTVDADGNVRLTKMSEGLDDAGREALDEAREVCTYALDGVTLGFSGEDSTEREDMFLAYAVCMRENGYDMPDPDFSNFGTPGGGGQRVIFGDIDREDPEFQAAQDVCAVNLSGGGQSGGTG
jgi:hypothetical protein